MYRYVCAIKLQKPTRIKDIPDMEVIKNAFNIISRLKTLTLTASSSDEKLQWMTMLSTQIATNLETNRSRTILVKKNNKQNNII